MSTDLQVWNPEKISLIQRVIAPSVSKDEFEMFIARCKQTGLDPIARQIYAISRYDKQVGGNKMSIQVSIDGMRLLAERSGKYAGQLGPLFCGPDGKEWYEVWTSNNPPYAAKVGILRSDFQQPLWSVAKYGEYVQTFKDGNPTGLWAKMPDLMLAKCAESLALRRAFPYETSGLYTREEMGQADNDVIEAVVSVAPADQPAAKPLLNGDGSAAQPKKLLDCYSDKLNALLLEFQRLQPQWCAKHSVWHMDILRSVLTIANDQPFPARFNEDDEHRFELYVESKREKAETLGK